MNFGVFIVYINLSIYCKKPLSQQLHIHEVDLSDAAVRGVAVRGRQTWSPFLEANLHFNHKLFNARLMNIFGDEAYSDLGSM